MEANQADVIRNSGLWSDQAAHDPPGDTAAYPARQVTELFQAHHLELVRLAVLMVGDLATAEDVVQDAFEQLHRRWRTLRKQSSALDYARSAVLNGSRSVLRRRGVARRNQTRITVSHHAGADVAADFEQRSELIEAFRQLPARQREVLALRYYVDMSVADAEGRVYLTDTTPLVARTTQLTVEGPADLATVPLPAEGPLPGSVVTDPLLLVCTHGRRDRCCALDGRALALAVGDTDVWECSHLGGHRFAPTALVLPTGYLYGRLDVSTAVSARKAAGLGEVEPALCRGRSTWSPAGQVAELAVRAATGLRDADALTVVEDGDIRVHARDGRSWTVDVEPADGPLRPASCGADAVPAQVLRAARVRTRA